MPTTTTISDIKRHNRLQKEIQNSNQAHSYGTLYILWLLQCQLLDGKSKSSLQQIFASHNVTFTQAVDATTSLKLIPPTKFFFNPNQLFQL